MHTIQRGGRALDSPQIQRALRKITRPVPRLMPLAETTPPNDVIFIPLPQPHDALAPVDAQGGPVTDTIPSPVIVARSDVGATMLGALTTALSWAAFGFCLCGGWHLMEWLIAKV